MEMIMLKSGVGYVIQMYFSRDEKDKVLKDLKERGIKIYDNSTPNF